MKNIENRLLKLEGKYRSLLHTKVTFVYGDGTTKEFVFKDAIQYLIDNMGTDEVHNVASIEPPDSCLDILLLLSNPVSNRNIEDFS